MHKTTVVRTRTLSADFLSGTRWLCRGGLLAAVSGDGVAGNAGMMFHRAVAAGGVWLLAAACVMGGMDTAARAAGGVNAEETVIVAGSYFTNFEPESSVLLGGEEAEDFVLESALSPVVDGDDGDQMVYYGVRGGGSRSNGVMAGMIGPANPRWEFTADALLLWQGNVSNRVFYTDQFGNAALESSQGQTPVSVGPRFGLLWNLDQTRAVELNYFQASPFRGEQTTPSINGEYTMNGLAGFDLSGVNGATFETAALIQSFEANWRRGNGGPLTWLVGFRWVEWNQSLSILDTAGQFVDTFDTRVGNDLYGGQIGLDAMLWNRDEVISVSGVGKAGVYYNTAYQQISANDGVARGPLRAAADETSFFGELGITMDTRITDWLSWRLGYSAFWLSGVAEAAGQLSSTNLQLPIPPPATIDTTGSVLLHGVTTGLEARW